MMQFSRIFFLAACFLVSSVCAQAQATNRTVKSGDFSDASVWSLRVVPNYNNNRHNIEINHEISFNQVEFWLGGQNQAEVRELVINISGSLKGNGKLIIPNNKSKLINHGSLMLSNSFTFGYNYQDSAYFVNTGEATISGMQELAKGSIQNSGTLTIKPTTVLNKITLKTATNSSTIFTSTVDINVGSTIINNGSFTISSTSDDALKINNGKFWNYGNVEIAGRLNLASGTPNNPVKNHGNFNAGRVYLNNSSSIENWGKFYCDNDFNNIGGGAVINHPCAYIEQTSSSRTFKNENSNTKLTNNGFILVKGNFLNNSHALLNGSGTLHIYGVSTNSDQARIEGRLCIYDFSLKQGSIILDVPNSNQATVATTVTRCASASAPAIWPTVTLSVTSASQNKVVKSSPQSICNFSSFELSVGALQTSTTYSVLESDEFIVEEVGPGKFSLIALVEDESNLGLKIITVTATNSCGSTSAQLKVNVIECGLANPLPVELTSFEGVFAKTAVKLTWQTASEKDNDFFAVERSANGQEFVKIGQVQGNGNSQMLQNYTFTDAQPSAGTVYYRLKQVDYNGAFEYSKVIAVQVKALVEVKGFTVNTVYPNPFSSEDVLTAEIELKQAGELTLSLVDVTGKTLQSTSVHGQAGLQSVTFAFTKNVPAGIYFLRVYQADQVEVHKLVKNR
ncbi:T9SS type A sorting domain-containing protein [Rufibacter sp. XAAS-G3-1]|uniref:T9SS type A sorting domain-containing protein n=1 Tax=Rufibacter sp. XAAS-G3-1 TaxID=2729134 RepID=UPI0015E6679B|nr:T9SS type A sorting domain-containing protein [Rufibacter sp. XAAS-G3-1]